MLPIVLALVLLSAVTFLTYAYRRKWFFLSVVDAEKYEREKPLIK